jgi:hypothetical protein
MFLAREFVQDLDSPKCSNDTLESGKQHRCSEMNGLVGLGLYNTVIYHDE